MYPGADPAALAPASVVFTPPSRPVDLTDPYQWWSYVPGANWRHPGGPATSLRSRLDHPVTHVAWADALAYAEWAGKQIPTEAEWEYAARGGLPGSEFAWGEELTPGGRYRRLMGNAPACRGTPSRRVNPVGGREADSVEPGQLRTGIPRKVIKGGSHLCAPNYCRRYRPAARLPQQIDTATCHVGFRCVVRATA